MTGEAESGGMLVGLAASRAAWSVELRGFLRDHLVGVTAITILDARQLRRRGQRPFDVVLLDDETRVFSAAEVGATVSAGTVVIGLFGARGGLGRDYLEGLGVSRVIPVGVPIGELARLLSGIGPTVRDSIALAGDRPTQRLEEGRRGRLMVFSGVSGNLGLSETMIGLGEEFVARRRRVLVVEANPLSATMAVRLRRDPAFGLVWVLGRVSQGRRSFPEALSPPHPEVPPVLGAFDVICQTARPGGPPPMSPIALAALMDEALAAYDEVLVEIGPLVTTPDGGAGDRFVAGRMLLGRADQAVVLAGGDPESAARLAEWRACAAELGGPSAVWAVFARVVARGNFEFGHLREIVAEGTGGSGFVGVHLLPEDRSLSRARWNGELVKSGRWRGALRALAAELAQAQPTRTVDLRAMGERPVSLAGEVGW